MAKVKLSVDEILEDPIQFIQRLKIINKKGKLVYLKPTHEQIEIIQALEEDKNLLILKPRQIGSSTINLAYLFWKTFTSKEPITVIILSHKLNSSKHLLGIVKTFYKNLPITLMKKLKTENTTELTFTDSGASIVAASAAGEGGLRSFTCSYLLISEFAFAPNPEELKATAVSALNDGKLIIESTASAYGDALHKEIMKSQRGEGNWKFLFFGWAKHKNYSLKVPRDFQKTEEEKGLANLWDLTDEQVYWRRKKREALGAQQFRREFPLTLDDAFAQTGNSYFTERDLRHLELHKIDFVDAEPVIFAENNKDHRYGIGVDVAYGGGRDYSVFYVMDKKTYQPVMVWRSNQTSIARFAEVIVDWARHYNNALICYESNNHGHALEAEMKHLGYTNFWLDENGRPWNTNLKTKPLMFEELKTCLFGGLITQLDNITIMELKAIIINDRGNIDVAEGTGSHGDSVIALALAHQALKHQRNPTQTYLPDWIRKRKAQRAKDEAGKVEHRRY